MEDQKRLCVLCQVNEADKKNTHYLTDGIIRKCLNIDGSSGRERGLYAIISSYSSFDKVKFQRSTPPEQIKDKFGREISDVDIEAAKSKPFSVDFVFCSICEDKFSAIESEFIDRILPKFRNTDLAQETRVTLSGDDEKLSFLFFYLQVWRTAICDSEFPLKDFTVLDNLRNIILNHENLALKDIAKYPIAVYHMETVGGDFEYTKNIIASMPDVNPYVIFMNDFVIQFYDSEQHVKPYEFYGLNQEDYESYINPHEDGFRVKIVHHGEKQSIYRSLCEEIGRKKLTIYEENFRMSWRGLFKEDPSPGIFTEYLKTITDGPDFMLKYTEECVMSLTRDFFVRKARERGIKIENDLQDK